MLHAQMRAARAESARLQRLQAGNGASERTGEDGDDHYGVAHGSGTEMTARHNFLQKNRESLQELARHWA